MCTGGTPEKVTQKIVPTMIHTPLPIPEQHTIQKMGSSFHCSGQYPYTYIGNISDAAHSYL